MYYYHVYFKDGVTQVDVYDNKMTAFEALEKSGGVVLRVEVRRYSGRKWRTH